MTRSRHIRPKVTALATAMSIGHVLYPAWLAVATRGRAPEHPARPSKWPPVTVLVPAYKEAGVIANKIADAHSNGYPGHLEVLVVTDGDEATASRARAAGATVVSTTERLGKSQALNLGFAHVTTPVVVVSDANTRISPGSIAAMTPYFETHDIGAVVGQKVESGAVASQSAYWRFESWLKEKEWRLGTTIGMVGELSAIRSAAWRPIPIDIASDDLWTALDLCEQGYRIAYEPEAKALEAPSTLIRQEWERRTRMASGALHVFARRRYQLGPAAGVVAAEIWGHRLARYTIAPIAHLTLLAFAVRERHSGPLARAFILANAAAAAALLQRIVTPRQRQGPITTLLADGAFLQAVAFGGMVRYLRGDRRTKWPRIER